MKELHCSVRKHSRKQLEIKLEYPLEKKKVSRFTLDCYFFFPARLHVTEKRIGVSGFLNNMQINTRFSSPLIPLEKVIDTEFRLSPLIRIENLLDSTGDTRRGFNKNMLYELQTLCNLYRAETRNFTGLMKKEIRKNGRGEIYRERILHMLLIIRSFLDRFRKLHSRFLDPHIEDDIRTALRWADESISIITEKGFLRLYDTCRSVEGNREITIMLEEMIDSEAKYRESMNFPYRYRENDPFCGETMAYRDSMLKKWSQSSMYMNSERSSTPHRVGHLIAGIAAALAMFFAVFAAIFAENLFPKNSSSWIMVIVLSYVLKDRIKEILRKVFKNLMPGLTTDQQTNLYDPALKTKTGRSSGTIRFTTPSGVPGEIRDMRYRDPSPFRKAFQANDVIHYRKRMKIKSSLLMKNHSRLEGLTEIIRFQIDHWLKEMDDPEETLYHLIEGEKVKIRGNRVYRVHLLLSIDDSTFHYILILNKSGIVRIEKSPL